MCSYTQVMECHCYEEIPDNELTKPMSEKSTSGLRIMSSANVPTNTTNFGQHRRNMNMYDFIIQ